MSNTTPVSSARTNYLSSSLYVAIGASALTLILAYIVTESWYQSWLIAGMQCTANLSLLPLIRRLPQSPLAASPSRSANQSNISLQPCVLWFTGLPSAGKTTLALLLKDNFETLGIQIEHLDGDAVRAIVPGTGFSRTERNDHIRRMGFLASRFEQQGITVIASFVSPYAESRDFVRRICDNFIEIYLSTSIDECTRRDVKGLYQEAKKGQRPGMTGIDDPYEAPVSPELVLDTGTLSKEQCVEKIKDYLLTRGLLRASSILPIREVKQLYGSSLAT